MRKTIISLLIASLLVILVGCGSIRDNYKAAPHKKNIIFDIDFDENKGNFIQDKVSKKKAKVEYVFEDAKFKEDRDPKWVKKSSARGSSLSFDGYSNKAEFDSSIVKYDREKMTIDVFVAPRMFEWSAPNDFNKLQIIVGQFDKEQKEGFLLGMYKHGKYSFQIGVDGVWYELWNEWNPLDRYQWNHLTATFDGELGEMKLYKNGELVNELLGTYGKMSPSYNNLIIGAHSDPNYDDVFELNMFNGLMDELKIFNKVYTKEDVLNNHKRFYVKNKIKEIDFNDAWLDESILYDDLYKPTFHATPPQHWMNEPHALFFFNGYYHLFYQFNVTGPYWRQIVWGHWVSEDMVNWENLIEPIILDQNTPIKDGAWSGGVSFDNEGNPVLFITAGDDERLGLYSNQNLVLARPKDLSDPKLIEWEVSNKLAIKQDSSMGRANEFRDFNIFKEDDTWYLLATGSKHNYQGTALIFSTKDDSFDNWEYHGEFFEPKEYPSYYGTSWELVSLSKVSNKSKTISKYLFVLSPAGPNSDNDVFYYLGDFDKENYRFIPEQEDALKMDFGKNVFTGPGVYMDYEHDRVLISSITQDQRSNLDHYYAGWAHSAGMPKELSLNDNGDLIVRPIKEIYNYIGDDYINITNQTIGNANSLLRNLNLNSQTIYTKMVLENISSKQIGFEFKKNYEDNKSSKFYYDFQTREIVLDTRNSGNTHVSRIIGSSYELLNNTLEIEMFIDHAVVEIYINKEKTLTASIYNIASGIELIANGNIKVKELSISEMKGIRK